MHNFYAGSPSLLTAAKVYSSAFYDETLLTSMRSADAVVPLILDLTGAESVVDLGCGTGSWLHVFKKNGVARILGVDRDSLSRANLQIDASEIVQRDLTEKLDIEQTFDLSTCLEVAEHLPAECADKIVQNLTDLAPIVLFSAAIPHQGGTNHINEQWPEYWAALFAARGYRVVDCIRDSIWKNEEVAYWYAQNLLLYVREDVLNNSPKLLEFAKHTNPARLTLVHPKVYVKNYKTLRSPKLFLMRMLWNCLPRAIRLRLVKPLSEVIWKQVSTKY
jgi:SAM-dependent methyltransferase